MNEGYLKGKGAQFNVKNPFLKAHYVTEHPEGLDEELFDRAPQRQVFYETPKKVVNKVDSPDLHIGHSLNPYQGCEHGCIYCYARNTHQYWGFSAGLDFESKIIVKKNAPQLLEKLFLSKTWRPTPIMVSGNTDCYQPLEQKLQITRSLLKIFLKYQHPLGMITKNSLVLRDLDLLTQLAKKNLVNVFISITSLQEKLRLKMEPRTANGQKRLRVLKELSSAGIPTGVMIAPIIPGLNDHEIPAIMKAIAQNGAQTAAYTVVRLNGSIGEIFKDWLYKNFPNKAQKVWDQIASLHGGKVNDSEWGRRMKGEGHWAHTIQQLFTSSYKKHMEGRSLPELDITKFRRSGNYNLF